jgi:hypothetical protein
MANRTSTHVTGRGKATVQKPSAMQSAQSTNRVVAKRGDMPRAKPAAIAPETRQQLIATLAYSIAERRGFVPGNELDDWLQAEAEVDARMIVPMQ